jgi:hypothetical protein
VRTLSCGLILLAAFAALTATAPADAARTTKIVIVTPVTGAGNLKPGYVITERVSSGRCPSGSDVVHGAYRCFAGNVVADPCWPDADQSPASVVCTQAPWSKKLYEIQKPGKLAHSPATLPATPMGVQLTDGSHCETIDGAASLYQGKVIRYACGKGSSGLIGQPVRTTGLWTIERVHYDKKSGEYVSGAPVKIAVYYEGKGIPWR